MPRGPVTLVILLVMSVPVDRDSGGAVEVVGGCDSGRPSVCELASKFGDANTDLQGKRDRSESGDPAPAGKRGAVERDPVVLCYC